MSMNETSGQSQVPAKAPAGAARHKAVALACALFVAGMVGASYAAVPLYRMFCQATGFGGATKVAETAPAKSIDRMMQVRFDANVAPGVELAFRPEQPDVRVKVGETKLVHYQATNLSAEPLTLLASYNVAPEVTGTYFAKLQCFCFNQLTLKPHETLDLPIVFFVDPAIGDDKTLDRISSITLSYTFFAAKQPERPVAEAGGARSRL